MLPCRIKPIISIKLKLLLRFLPRTHSSIALNLRKYASPPQVCFWECCTNITATCIKILTILSLYLVEERYFTYK